MTALRKAAAALLLLLAAGVPAGAVERILLFISDVTVERSSDLAVTETIRVQAEGREIRRGIFRDFPTIYYRRDGSRVVVGFEVKSVTRDGAPEPWTTERMSNGLRLRIGSPDRMVGTGPHEYVIRYRTTRQIGFFADRDELYWNATGTGWGFRIDQAEARITLPEPVPFRQAAAYTGAQGQPGRDASVVEQRPGHIVFRTTKALPARSGLTIGVAWNKGVVAPPSGERQAAWWFEDNLAVVVALAGLGLLLGFYGLAWKWVGRDPPRGTIIPLFAAPPGMSAAGVRFVDRMGFDQRCFTAAVIDLGVNGHLKLIGEGTSTTVERRNGNKPVPAAEQAMKKRLFEAKQSVELDQVNHEAISGAKAALAEGLNGQYLGQLFTNNFGWSGLGLVLVIVLAIVVAVLIVITRGGDQGAMLNFGMLVPALFIMGGAALIFPALQPETWSAAKLIGGLLVAGIPAAGGLFFTWLAARGWVDLVPALAIYTLAAIAGLGFRWLQAPSVGGRKIMDQIEGFRLYLGVAEESRLEALHPPEKTPELFERFLPYAIALDVENTWAKRFAGVLAAAGTAAAATTAIWYSGHANWANDPVGFVDHVGSDLNSTIASASTAPGSSDSGGSSGGGFSGGGGGGGGGGGW